MVSIFLVMCFVWNNRRRTANAHAQSLQFRTVRYAGPASYCEPAFKTKGLSIDTLSGLDLDISR